MSNQENKNSQEEVWDNIADPWKKFRAKPIQEAIDFLKTKKGKIIDLGCGSGRNFFKNSNLKIYGVDFSQKMLDHSKKHAEKEKIDVELIKSPVNNLPFKDNFFDSAIFIATLHCLETKEKRKKSLEELYRVLKPGKEVLITVWDKDQKKFKNKPKENYIVWQNKGKRYYYLYEKQELIHLLEKIGFEIIKVYKKENENIKYSTRKRYSDKNILVIVKKPTSS